MIGLINSTLRMPPLWLVWIAFLGVANLIAPLYFIQTLEARVTLFLFGAGVVIQSIIHLKLGFVRLLGIGHIFWIPFVVWLAFRIGSFGIDGAFGFWIASLLLLNSISLVIDATDVTRYILGERKPFY
jgi:hypothetical protein